MEFPAYSQRQGLNWAVPLIRYGGHWLWLVYLPTDMLKSRKDTLEEDLTGLSPKEPRQFANVQAIEESCLIRRSRNESSGQD